MWTRSFYIIVLNYFFLLLSACHPRQTTNSLFQEVRRIVDTNPDSAILVLDSIALLGKLSESDQMEYYVRSVQARYKNFIPISSDTTILDARDYFANKIKDNWELGFLGYFYSGCVYRERQQYEYAIKEYKFALDLAEQNNDEVQQALVLYNIGSLYFDKRSYEQALDFYLLAASKYDGHFEKITVSLHSAAQAALLCDKIDDALSFFDKGLYLAKQQKDKIREANFLHDKAIVLYNQHKYQEALSHLYQAKGIESDTTNFARYYLNFAKIYMAMDNLDSTTFYTEKLQQTIDDFSDLYFQVSANKFLAEIFAAGGEYHMATQHLQAQNNRLVEILEKENVAALAEAERKIVTSKFTMYKKWQC